MSRPSSNTRSDYRSGIGSMMAKALDANLAAKVYIVGRRLDRLREVASMAVFNSSEQPQKVSS